MPPNISEEKMAALSEALLNGRKIEAIKLYREYSGVGLKEAKEEIERMEASLREKFPEKFTKAKGGGCAGVFALICVLIGAFALWIGTR